MTPIQAAQHAADEAFEEALGPRDSAMMSVPESVVRAARIAYAGAGGKAAIRVVGRGNSSHPVIGVSVYHDARRQAMQEHAACLRQYAAEAQRRASG